MFKTEILGQLREDPNTVTNRRQPRDYDVQERTARAKKAAAASAGARKPKRGSDARDPASSLFSIAAHGASLPNLWRGPQRRPLPNPLRRILLREMLSSVSPEARGEGGEWERVYTAGSHPNDAGGLGVPWPSDYDGGSASPRDAHLGNAN